MCTERRIVDKILDIYSIDAGCTCPIRVELDNGSRAVLKYPHNPQGILVLLNEYITGCLARAIGLTIPKFGVAVVDNNTKLHLQSSLEVSVNTYLGAGFYSEYIPKTAPVSPRTLKYATNLSEVNKIILLDHIVKNKDRHEGNVLITANSTTPVIYAIDHSHSFGGPEWNVEELQLNDILSPYIWRENQQMYNMFIDAGAPITSESLIVEGRFMQEHITNDLLSDIFDSLPSEWSSVIGQENISHLQQYILNRVNNLEAICAMINQERGV